MNYLDDNMKKIYAFLYFVSLCWLLSACQRNNIVCPPVTGSPLPAIDQQELNSREATPVSNTKPIPVEINGRLIPMDRIVEGPLCNDSWSGKVYVGCGVRVAEWIEDPLFLKNCDLVIEPGTVVYVAAHNNEAYYKGCSCHTGELPEQ